MNADCQAKRPTATNVPAQAVLRKHALRGMNRERPLAVQVEIPIRLAPFRQCADKDALTCNRCRKKADCATARRFWNETLSIAYLLGRNELLPLMG